jgi:Protein of unknown function (DUF4236)
MGLRFYRRVHLFPGVGVNFSRSGPSLTLGVRGAHVTLGRRGVTRTVGLPGTGLYYTSRSGYHSGYHSAHSNVPLDPRAQAAANRRAEVTLALVVCVVLVIVVLMAL